MVRRPLAWPTVKLETLVPTGRWLEAAVSIATLGHSVGKGIVGGTFFLVAQHVFGLVDITHLDLRIGLFADVRVVLACQFSVGLAHLVIGRTAL